MLFLLSKHPGFHLCYIVVAAFLDITTHSGMAAAARMVIIVSQVLETQFRVVLGAVEFTMAS